MDDRLFDGLTKALTDVSPRRAVTRLLMGTTLGAVWAGWTGSGPETAAGKRKKKKKKKKPPVTGCLPTCAGKNCGDSDGCGGRCTVQQGCGAGQSCVAGACVDGDCSPSCTGGRTCVSGACTCPATARDCGDAGCAECCANAAAGNSQCCPPARPDCLSSDGNRARLCIGSGTCACREEYPYYWAALGTSPQCWECQTDEHCMAQPAANAQKRHDCFFGNCVCPADQTLCRVFQSNPLRSECTNMNADPTNCGFCGNVCNLAIGQTCVGGACVNPGPD